ncbi:MAG: UvrD-helicase domain-containing protein, partial [Bacteroidales bacterium]|nr:UvrD-helicase domain-containing protein [Bacteroidales bacterium]
KISEIVFSEPVPFIYERLGERYKHFFIDEFQDTSVLQWMNLLPLLDNSLAEGNFNMVVGDGKQAIYRFRNGEIEQFVRLPKLVDKTNNPINLEREQSLKRNFLGLELKKNYRSRQNVVEFNNDLFTYISETILPQNCREIYQNPRQEINKEKPRGFVSIDFLEKNINAEVSFEDATHYRILEIIYRQIELGFEYKDIAILCRGNKESSYIANYLAKNAIPVVSSESLLLAYSPSVSFLIACMKLIHDQDNGILREEIKRFLSNEKRREEVADEEVAVAVAVAGEEEVADEEVAVAGAVAVAGEKEVAGAVKEMDLFDKATLSRLSKFPVYDLCEELISIFDLNDEIDPYIHYFLDKVFEFTSKHNTATVDFIDWWEDKKEKLSLVIPEETNAVRIMTIHKAKGLEFPVVIFPYANEKLKISENIFWISNEDENISKLPFLMLPAIKGALEKTDYYPYYQNEENKSFLDLTNVLYVVMTRAVDSLYVISEKPKDKETVEDSDKSKMHFMLSAFLMHSGTWSDEQINYSFGEETQQSAESDVVRQKSYKLEKAISRDWRKHALISKRAPEIWDIDDPNRNRQWGNLVHTVLSKIKYLEDKDAVLDKFYLEGYFDKDEKKKLSGKIDKVFNNQLVRLFFTKGVEIKNEAEILLPDGKSYRPDRIVLDGKKAVVIDYKTGKSSEYHKKQLDNYASLLIDMGYEVDKKYLIYIDDEVEVVEV